MAHATGKRLLAMLCVVGGAGISLTIVGALLGLPMILYGVHIWRQARKQERRVERQAELVDRMLEREG